MIALTLLGLLIAAGVGGVICLVLHLLKDDYKITRQELPILIPVLLVLVLVTSIVGYKVAVGHNVTYKEFWGGYEVSVQPVTYACQESSSQGGYTGGCVNYYDADSYEVYVHSESCTTDSKGHEHCVDTSHWETRWRQVPYTDTETTYIIHTTLGDYTIGYHWLPADPQAHRLAPMHDAMEALPGDLPSGIPAFWQAARDRIDSGNPGPVTAEKSYVNYILASQSTILHKYSPWIAQYQKAGLLPDINHSIHSFYYLDRVYAVGGVNIGDMNAWQNSINRFDAALGADLTGDLYLVVVPSDKISDPNTYSMSLTAYWESKKFDKYDISKNGIIVVVGTRDGKTVDWALATTGMPSGNEMMLLDIHNQLPGTPLTPEALLGSPRAQVSVADNTFKVAIDHTNGALEKIVWGPDKFQRVHMSKGSTRGYLYLKDEITISGAQEFWILFIIFILSGVAWGVAFGYGVPAYQNYRSNS